MDFPFSKDHSQRALSCQQKQVLSSGREVLQVSLGTRFSTCLSLSLSFSWGPHLTGLHCSDFKTEVAFFLETVVQLLRMLEASLPLGVSNLWCWALLWGRIENNWPSKESGSLLSMFKWILRVYQDSSFCVLSLPPPPPFSLISLVVHADKEASAWRTSFKPVLPTGSFCFCF